MGTSHSKHKQYYDMHHRIHAHPKQIDRKTHSVDNRLNNKALKQQIDYIHKYRQNENTKNSILLSQQIKSDCLNEQRHNQIDNYKNNRRQIKSENKILAIQSPRIKQTYSTVNSIQNYNFVTHKQHTQTKLVHSQGVIRINSHKSQDTNPSLSTDDQVKAQNKCIDSYKNVNKKIKQQQQKNTQNQIKNQSAELYQLRNYVFNNQNYNIGQPKKSKALYSNEYGSIY